MLKLLSLDHGAARLYERVASVPRPHPRNVTITAEERAAVLAAAPTHLRCWLLLCADLGIRSGTAATLGPRNYDRQARTLTFTTKYNECQTLPVTHELQLMLDTCKKDVPFVAQLPRGYRGKVNTLSITSHALRNHFAILRRSCGITRSVTPHDLRRTVARRIYGANKDLRVAQALLGHTSLKSTLWYLQDDLVAVPLAELEAAKLPLTEKLQ